MSEDRKWLSREPTAEIVRALDAAGFDEEDEVLRQFWRVAWDAAPDLAPGEERARALEEAAGICEKRAERRWQEHGYTDPETNAGEHQGSQRDWYQAQDEEDENCAAAIRAKIEHRRAQRRERQDAVYVDWKSRERRTGNDRREGRDG